jgi:hypothetical protein
LRLVAGGWFVLSEKYCGLVADKPSEQAAYLHLSVVHSGDMFFQGYFIAIEQNAIFLHTLSFAQGAAIFWTPS